MAHLAKKVKKNNALVDRTKFYSVEDAVAILLTAAKDRKFVETIEIAMNLGVDPKHHNSQKNLHQKILFYQSNGKLVFF